VRFKPDDFRVGTGVKSFQWTGRNHYMILSDGGFISVGGGSVSPFFLFPFACYGEIAACPSLLIMERIGMENLACG
jgi:hypothetical protein